MVATCSAGGQCRRTAGGLGALVVESGLSRPVGEDQAPWPAEEGPAVLAGL